MSLSVTLDILSTSSGFLPVAAALYNYKRLDKVLKISALYFLISCTFDPIAWLLAKSGSKNNMPLFHLNVLVSLVFYTLIYYNLFSRPVLKKVTVTIAAVTLGLMLFFNTDIYDYPTVSNTALSISMIILSLIYFYELLNPLKYVDIEKQGPFWINAGVLLYTSVNIFLVMLLTQIPVNDRPNYYIINSITNIIANTLFSVGLLCKPQKTT
ncbi:hypothetical protein [Mucilaginibacter dorajii]|uniref:hypothetical protein n=1 Tax=Mucilaginibacter dorajii TaxID=692994 RepID=UPI0021675F0A|nr:hypothetical protein [Mucilaginibacter dorajii]MCS3737432.1 hypothetical protein [Mucilaginibacter dorajii]